MRPLIGWGDFGWSGDVLQGVDPAGRGWSVGEVLQEGEMWAIRIARSDRDVLAYQRTYTREAAVGLAPTLVRDLGGSWPDHRPDYPELRRSLRQLGRALVEVARALERAGG